MRSITLVAAAVALAVAGCAHTRDRKIELRTARAPGRVAPEQASPVQWRQIELGYRPRTTPIGYLKTEAADETGAEQHWVYGMQFELIGHVSPRGRTVRFVRRGSVEVEVQEGSYLIRHAILKLFGHTKERAIQLAPMPAPG